MKPPRSILKLFPDLTKCTDAKQPAGIEVTTKDVANSRPGDPAACAMARAICREWHADAAVIGMTDSYVIKGNSAVRFQTPESVSREIVSFDRKAGFAPGKYHLGSVSKSLRRTSKGRGGKKRPTASHRPKRVVFHKESLRVRSMRAGVR